MKKPYEVKLGRSFSVRFWRAAFRTCLSPKYMVHFYLGFHLVDVKNTRKQDYR